MRVVGAEKQSAAVHGKGRVHPHPGWERRTRRVLVCGLWVRACAKGQVFLKPRCGEADKTGRGAGGGGGRGVPMPRCVCMGAKGVSTVTARTCHRP